MKFSGFRSWLQNERFLRYLNRLSFLLSLITVLIAIYDLGYRHAEYEEEQLSHFYFGALIIGVLAILLRYFLFKVHFRLKVRIFDSVLGTLFALLIFIKIDGVLENLPFMEFMNQMVYVYIAALIYFVREFSTVEFSLNSQYLNPAQLFISSFLLIILAGTALLMLPKATYEGISLLDALFTSTSAVCVTGLIVVDTGSYFTLFGQTIILMLMQIGGLGIMTFASYFSYFFRGQTSYQSQLMLKDATNSDKIGEVFSVLKKILFITFIVELLGTIFIYFSLNNSEITHIGHRLFFSIFHAVSGFCNAGFSTLENSLYEPDFRFNYPLHLIIASLFILGGIGFPIVLNIYKYTKYTMKNLYSKIRNKEKLPYSPWVINLNTRIVIVTTFILLSLGTIGFYVSEYNNTLAEHNWFGKIVTAFFGAATPRTAGFNSVDTSALNFSTIMLMFILMWIGASPASTGGGIKTSTIAVATLNFFSLAKGKDRIEVYRREISQASIRRAFAIISLSLMIIGISIFLIASFDQDKTLLSIVFESFSAYSTVGLSTGITSDLSANSKVVIIFTMFIGRVSMLTLLIAILRRVKHLNYRYPSDEILIN
ncbi:TrkH family potassium uptake protein [Christiangramia forsetii]|uniref:V-type sodium ATP synthase subunit J n=2 Tax=Christiangramia forsetii TaxID=411153 RepID=A0M4E3_CHRFK|nr:potassium transporter TrkG [Christiangramia forsetii]GGG23613.1 potassium transporter [Christiangramia forsetii]CAL67488.1 V-type sodium ATP synthase subunit J [Christiangramia forsetii KT0803]